MKKSFKQLHLNKITISNLNNAQMNQLNGGGEKQSAKCKPTIVIFTEITRDKPECKVYIPETGK